VTPLVSIVDELSQTDYSLELRFWCDRRYYIQAHNIMKNAELPVKSQKLLAGKFRRYHNTSNLEKLLDFSTNFNNFKDLILIILGFFQSLWRLVWWRPDAVFCKGGFVCLPIGYAASLLRIPIIIHDSDAHPGLTNRLLSGRAKYILTGAPLEYYPYPKSKSDYVGIPVGKAFHPYSQLESKAYKKKSGYDVNKPMIVITGGGLGALRLNRALMSIAEKLAETCTVVHLTGQHDFEVVVGATDNIKNYHTHAFISDNREMASLLASADIVIARAGATTLAELAAVRAPTILIPNGQLTGGHQLKNSQVYVDAGAAEVVTEDAISRNEEVLYKTIIDLLNDKCERDKLAHNIAKFSRPDAAFDISKKILEVVGE
jgi:UDP-N-acetylglucosamine--N-acetylmuramyl-(pentapeptide) pyrophosphoryl-undecaprenol N-acetylglucosamine transferase